MEASKRRYGGEWTLDQLADLAAGTGNWPDHLRTPVRKLAAQKAFPDLIAAACERDTLRAYAGPGPYTPSEADGAKAPTWQELRDLADHNFRLYAEAVAERDQLRATVERVRALFVGGPDTPCRTTWPEGVEHVEIPMSEVRRAWSEANPDGE